MTDIVERLRLFVPHCEDPNDYLEDELLFLEAADQIERLRNECARFRAALNAISCQDADYKDEGVVWCAERARTALGFIKLEFDAGKIDAANDLINRAALRECTTKPDVVEQERASAKGESDD